MVGGPWPGPAEVGPECCAQGYDMPLYAHAALEQASSRARAQLFDPRKVSDSLYIANIGAQHLPDTRVAKLQPQTLLAC